jgi:hypothetical protein
VTCIGIVIVRVRDERGVPLRFLQLLTLSAHRR